MAETFHAQILTPEGKRFEGKVLGVQVPGVSGSFEMRAGHAPIISTLDIGRVRVKTGDGSEIYFAVSGGFVEMNKNQMTLLAEAAEIVEDIDVERARKAKERALEGMKNKNSVNYESLKLALKRAENRLELVDKQL